MVFSNHNQHNIILRFYTFEKSRVLTFKRYGKINSIHCDLLDFGALCISLLLQPADIHVPYL